VSDVRQYIIVEQIVRRNIGQQVIRLIVSVVRSDYTCI